MPIYSRRAPIYSRLVAAYFRGELVTTLWQRTINASRVAEFGNTIRASAASCACLEASSRVARTAPLLSRSSAASLAGRPACRSDRTSGWLSLAIRMGARTNAGGRGGRAMGRMRDWTDSPQDSCCAWLNVRPWVHVWPWVHVRPWVHIWPWVHVWPWVYVRPWVHIWPWVHVWPARA